MKLAIGNDHAGVEMKWEIMNWLQDLGHQVINVGTDSTASFDSAISAFKVARLVADGKAEGGILICGTGIGISMAANKLRGIRACVCSEPLSAREAREQLNANIIAFGARVIGRERAKMIVECWLNASYDPANQQQLEIIERIENDQSL